MQVTQEQLNKPVGELCQYGLSPRTVNRLQSAGIETIGDLADCTRGRLLRIRQLGNRGVSSIRDSLAEMFSGKVPEHFTIAKLAIREPSYMPTPEEIERGKDRERALRGSRGGTREDVGIEPRRAACMDRVGRCVSVCARGRRYF